MKCNKHVRNLILIVFIFITTSSSFGQVDINPGVDTLDSDVKSAIAFYRQYVDEFKKGSPVDYSKYFSSEESKQFKIPDKIAYSFLGNTPIYKAGIPTIIYIKPKDGIINIKTHFGETDSTQKITTICITNHYVKFDKEHKPYFITPLSINLKQWQSETNRNVTYYFPKYHQFNKAKSDSLIKSIIQLEKDWDLTPVRIRYYFAGTNDEINNIRGFDYNFTMGNIEKPSGLSDAADNLVFSSGWDENYFHEIVHLYLNALHPKSPLNEGLAVYYGGSMGQNVYWHLNRLNQYLIEHPEIDLNSPDKFYYMDNYTNPTATLRALLCDLAFKKGGIFGLKKIMTYSSIDEILSNEFNVKKEDWNTFYRSTLKNYSPLILPQIR